MSVDEQIEEALAEVERLTASMEEVIRRLTDTEWSSHPDDRIRVALLHAEAALEGKSRPLAMVKDAAHAAGYAEGVAKAKAGVEQYLRPWGGLHESHTGWIHSQIIRGVRKALAAAEDDASDQIEANS